MNVKSRGKRAADYSPVKGQTTLVNANHTKKRSEIRAPIRSHIHNASTDNPANHHNENEVVKKIFVMTETYTVTAKIMKAYENGKRHQYAVPMNSQWTERKGNRVNIFYEHLQHS